MAHPECLFERFIGSFAHHGFSVTFSFPWDSPFFIPLQINTNFVCFSCCLAFSDVFLHRSSRFHGYTSFCVYHLHKCHMMSVHLWALQAALFIIVVAWQKGRTYSATTPQDVVVWPKITHLCMTVPSVLVNAFSPKEHFALRHDGPFEVVTCLFFWGGWRAIIYLMMRKTWP